MPTPARPRTVIPIAPIAILTDFGYRDHYVGVMKGVIAAIAPAAPTIDITHGVPAQAVMAGAILLRESWRHFPKRTIFLAIVDPGVGSARRPIVIETAGGARFVGPDNGLLSIAAAEAVIRRVIELDPRLYQPKTISSTFHGRDVFAPAAAILWKGRSLASLGRPLDAKKIETIRIPEPEAGARSITGQVIYIDGYGNLVTNIQRADLAALAARFPGHGPLVKIARGATIELLDTYADAPTGMPLAAIGSFELMEIAVRDGSAAARFSIGLGAIIRVVLKQ